MLYYAIWIAFECHLWMPALFLLLNILNSQHPNTALWWFLQLQIIVLLCSLLCPVVLLVFFFSNWTKFWKRKRKSLLLCRCWSESIRILGHLLLSDCTCSLSLSLHRWRVFCALYSQTFNMYTYGHICHVLLQYPLPPSEITYTRTYTHGFSYGRCCLNIKTKQQTAWWKTRAAWHPLHKRRDEIWPAPRLWGAWDPKELPDPEPWQEWPLEGGYWVIYTSK